MPKSRILFLFIIFAAAWASLVMRAAQLQILPDQKLAGLKKKQYRTVIELPPRRGSLLDRRGKELAVSVPAYSLFADPKLIKNPRNLSKKLAPLLGISYSSLYKSIRNSDRRFVWLKRRLENDLKEKISSFGERGLGFVEESRRVYPNGEFLSSVIGFVGSDGKGLEGLERHYDSYLRGEKKILRVERDARGRPLVLDGQVFTEMPAGADIELTIDSELQFVLEKSLKETVESFSADSAMGLVLDVQTNEVLAMAQTPSYDLNRALKYKPEIWRNRAITDILEPGSVVKSLVIAGALNDGKYKPNTKINCEGGKFKIGRRTIREADTHHEFNILTLSEVLAKSSNVGTSKVALDLGDQKVREILSSFGFGASTGIEFQGEANGILHKTPWRDHLLANVSFGHGVAASPLQVANAYAAIANGGELRSPLLVRAIRSAETGEEVRFQSKKIRRVLSEETASTMRLMLTNVTAETGTGYMARVPGFPVAGKTGTSQKLDENGSYKNGTYISGFAGMVPSNDPRFVIYVTVDNPRDKYYGSEVAAPLFSRIASYALRKSGLSPILISEANIVKPEAAVQKDKVKRIREMAEVLRSNEANSVPDLRGLSLREALSRIRGSDLKVNINGRGVVADMSPSPGEKVPDNKVIRLKLQ